MATIRSTNGLDVVLDASRTNFLRKFGQFREARVKRKVYRATLYELSVLTDRDLCDLGILAPKSKDWLWRRRMAVSSQTAGSGTRQTVGTLTALAKAVPSFWATATQCAMKAKAHAQSALTGLQTARMMSTLSSMDDNQLAQIGISRSDIPHYAERLMVRE